MSEMNLAKLFLGCLGVALLSCNEKPQAPTPAPSATPVTTAPAPAPAPAPTPAAPVPPVVPAPVVPTTTPATSSSAQAPMVSQVTQYGITWTFAAPVPSGQFANGDYWVVGPVKIITINPPSAELIGTTTLKGFTLGGSDPQPRMMHGSMLNPMPVAGGQQGYDSDIYRWHPISGRMYPARFDPSKNVALGVSASHPLELSASSSLVSTISHEMGGRPQLRSAAVLTVLASVPPDLGATSFRPPYSGSDKPLYSVKSLRKDLLPNLPLVTPMPKLESLVSKFQRPWIDHFSHLGDGTQYASPSENMPNYGREWCAAVGEAALMLMLKEEDLIAKQGQNKDALLIRFVQLGIDLSYIADNGGFWWGKGGLNHGRKWPIIFAGLMLDNQHMQTIGSRSKDMPYWGFAEDGQTSFIDQAAVDMTHSAAWAPDKRSKKLVPYEPADIGMAEWNVGGFAPGLDGPKTLNNFLHHLYRTINGMSYPGLILPALLMGQQANWKHDALFVYTDRYVAWAMKEADWNDQEKTQHIFSGAFQRAMWETYRSTVVGGKPAQPADDRPTR